jgi:hypothetical protein
MELSESFICMPDYSPIIVGIWERLASENSYLYAPHMMSKNDLAIKIEERIEAPMIILALLIIPVVIVELEIVSTNAHMVSYATRIDDGIWFAFLLEYLILVRLYDDKVAYTKRSWLNLLILLLSPPLISPEGFAAVRGLRSFRAFRVFRTLRSLRIVLAFKRGIKPISEVLVKNSLHYVTLITILLIFSAGMSFCWIEYGGISIQGIFQGVWWAITTVTTVWLWRSLSGIPVGTDIGSSGNDCWNRFCCHFNG